MYIHRDKIIDKINSTKIWDVVIIGGGASGLGVALDAVSRGLSCIVIEKEDFGSGTSSKSTKLVHGGVRYLAQGFVSLVIEALRERSYFLSRAHHVSGIQKFVIPAYGIVEALKYYIGLKIYDILAINKSLGKTSLISAKNTLNIFPSLKSKNLICGIEYTDGKFDDARMCIDLVNTIFDHHGFCINYFQFDNFIKENNTIKGITVSDTLTRKKYEIHGLSIINATGVHAGDLLEKDDAKTPIKIVPSQGSHLVYNKKITTTEYGLMIPKTSDGRVLFAIPWKNKLLVGTTDIAQKNISDNPKPSENEVTFIMDNLHQYCGDSIKREDISTTFAGLRPLAAPKEGKSKTKEISRSHKVVTSTSGLISIIGGKWTTFRKMGQDTIDVAIENGHLTARKSDSENIKIKPATICENHSFIHEELPYSIADFKNIINAEWVETLDDLLSRRTRCTFISLHATKQVYIQVLQILADEKKWTAEKSLANKATFEKKYDLLSH